MVAAVEVTSMAFITIFLMVFALFLLIAGIFTAYFGSGKSRKIGVGLLVAGILIGLIWGYGAYTNHLGPLEIAIDLSGLIWGSFLVILAGVLGALVAIGLFLVSIMKA